MRSSYLFQLVNLLASASLLILVLAGLSTNNYLQWMLFTTIAGAFIQLEGSLSVVTARFISREATQGQAQLARAIAVARRIYRRFATLGALAMALAGGAYLYAADNGRFDQTWPIEWAIFCAAYAGYYFFNANACSLIALQRLAAYAWVGIVSRLGNLLLCAVLLSLGVLGLCVAVLASFVLGALGYYLLLHRSTRALPDKATEGQAFSPGWVVVHAMFILASYSVYRYGLLLGAGTSSDTSAQASYSLALQIFTLIVTLSSVPLTMRVAPLVSAVARGERVSVLTEIGRLTALVNLVYLGATSSLVLGSTVIARVLPTGGAQLPSMTQLIALSVAFWVEINIMVVVNAMLAAQDFAFCWAYIGSLAVVIATATALWLLGAPFYVTFVAAPLVCQSLIALTLIHRLFRRQFQLKFLDHFRETAIQVKSLASNPLAVIRMS